MRTALWAVRLLNGRPWYIYYDSRVRHICRDGKLGCYKLHPPPREQASSGFMHLTIDWRASDFEQRAAERCGMHGPSERLQPAIHKKKDQLEND